MLGANGPLSHMVQPTPVIQARFSGGEKLIVGPTNGTTRMNRFADREGGDLPGLERGAGGGRHARGSDDTEGVDVHAVGHATGGRSVELGGGHSAFPFFGLRGHFWGGYYGTCN